MGNAFFKASGLNVKYGDIQVLWDVSFEAEKGEIIALVGSNGAGKSTSVKTVAGLIRHTSGTILFDGKEIPGGRRSSQTSFHRPHPFFFHDRKNFPA